ncbi:hypothetical protein Peur_029333 [Populus x canadensis]
MPRNNPALQIYLQDLVGRELQLRQGISIETQADPEAETKDEKIGDMKSLGIQKLYLFHRLDCQGIAFYDGSPTAMK